MINLMFPKFMKDFFAKSVEKTIKDVESFDKEYKKRTKEIDDFNKEMKEWSSKRRLTRNK